MRRERFARCVLGAVVVASGVGVAARAQGADPVAVPAPADPATVPGYDSDPLSLLGPSRVTPSQMAAFVAKHNPRTTVPIEELANIFAQEGAALGVRADIAWTQSIIETGFFHFPDRGMVHPQDNNFAGIGACDSCSSGHGYPDARTGVRAQMQLLRGYADPNTLPDAMIRPPKSYRGSAPTWWQMGNGHWATSTRYASSITSMYGSLLRSVGIDLAFRPVNPIIGDPSASVVSAVVVDPIPAEPPVREGDGMYLADADGQIYDLGDARFWGSAPNQVADATASASPPNGGVHAIAMTPQANGYWVFSSDGSVANFGDAPQFGDAPSSTVAVAALRDGYGYWTVNRSGVVEAFGAAPRIAPASGAIANDARIVAIVVSPTGHGYWLADSLGRVVGVGDAVHYGNAVSVLPSDPVVGFAATRNGDGYWLVTASGAVQSFGAAKGHGGLSDEFADDADRATYPTVAQRRYLGALEAARHLVVSINAAPSGDGYWLVTADGNTFGRGEAPDFDQTTTNGTPILAATAR